MNKSTSNIFAILLFCFAPLSMATTYVPISVGDITVIIPINDVPVVVDDVGLAVDEDVAASFDILINDTDEQLQLIQSQCSTSPFVNCVELIDVDIHQVSFSGGLLNFKGGQDFYGQANLSYRIFDEQGANSDSASVSITVNPIADNPVAVKDGYENNPGIDRIIEITAYEWHEVDFLWNDYDPDGEELQILAVKEAYDWPGVTVELSEDKKRVRIFSTEFNSYNPYSIDYRIEDSSGARSGTGTSLWTFSEVYIKESTVPNVPPTVQDYSASITENLPPNYCNAANYEEYLCVLEMDVLQNVTDPDGNDTNLNIIGLDAGWPSVTVAHGWITPNNDQSRRFSYKGYTHQGIISILNDKLYYRPKENFYNDAFGSEDRFKVKIQDERGAIVEQLITVTRADIPLPSVPNPPSQPTVSQSGSSLTLDWNDVNASYYVLRYKDMGGSYQEVGTQYTAHEQTWANHTGLTGRVYSIKACNELDQCSVYSVDSNPVIGPAKPAAPVLSATATELTLNWTGTASYYTLRYKQETESGTGTTSAGQYTQTSVTWPIANLVPGRHYAIQACDSSSSTCSQFSDWSNALAGVPSQPTWSKSIASVAEGLTLSELDTNVVSCVSASGLQFTRADPIKFYEAGSATNWNCYDSADNLIQSFAAPITIDKLPAPTNLQEQ